MNRVPQALLFQRLVPAYRVPLFRELWERAGVLVCHSRERRGASLRSAGASLDFPNERLARVYAGRGDTYCLQSALGPLLRHRPRVVVSEFAVGYGTLWTLLGLRALLGFRLLLWTHGVDNEEMAGAPTKASRERLKAAILRRADGVICYTEGRAARLRERFPSTKVWVAHNTLDTATLRREIETLRASGRETARAAEGFGPGRHLIFTGRLVPAKNLDLLLGAFERLRGRSDLTLHVVGTGPELRKLEAAASQDPRIRLHGEIYDPGALARLHYASDLMVHPGALGLAVLQSFAAATPVLTCRPGPAGPWHGPEYEYLRDGFNGVAIDADPTDAAAFALGIEQTLDKPGLLESLGEGAARTAEEYSIERFVREFSEALRQASGPASGR